MGELKKRFDGCLIGGAVGDALGYPVEFFSLGTIRQKYGDRGFCQMETVDGVAQISDDTQMALFTAEGLLLSKKRGVGLKRSIYLSYLDWLTTQNTRRPSEGARGLMSVAALYSRRAPGGTCLSALGSGNEGGIATPVNRSKGCGGVMRTAPVALYCFARGAGVLGADELAAEAAAITHGHALGHMPSYTLNHILYLIFDGIEIGEAVNMAIAATAERYEAYEEAEEGLLLFDKALTLANDPTVTDERAINILGAGWVAEEALAIAIYCAVRHKDDFYDAVCAAVNHSGDSDSTGAIAGNIIGAYLGIDAIPESFTENLEHREIILKLSSLLRGK